MPDTIVALFKDKGQAESAVRALLTARFDSRVELRKPGEAQLPDFGAVAARGVSIGYVGGTVLGIVVGVIAAGVIPGTHQFLHGGLFVPFMLAIAFGATGGLAGLLFSISLSQEKTLFYEQEMQSGRYLVSVQAVPERAETARQILLLAKGAMEVPPIESPSDSPAMRRGRRAVE